VKKNDTIKKDKNISKIVAPTPGPAIFIGFHSVSSAPFSSRRFLRNCGTRLKMLHFGTKICVAEKSFKALLLFSMVQFLLLAPEIIFTRQYSAVSLSLPTPNAVTNVSSHCNKPCPTVLGSAISHVPSAYPLTYFPHIFRISGPEILTPEL